MARITEETIAQTPTTFKGVVLPTYNIYIYFDKKVSEEFLTQGTETAAALFPKSPWKGADYLIRVTFQDFSVASTQKHTIIAAGRVRCMIDVSSTGLRWRPQAAFDKFMKELGFKRPYTGSLDYTAENITCEDALNKCEKLKAFFASIG